MLIEKPLGLNVVEASKILNAAKRNKVYLKTGFNLRYDSGIQLAKKLIDSKKIGKIYFIKIDYVNGSVKTNKNNIGALSDIGSHSINLFEFLLVKILILLITQCKEMNILRMIMDYYTKNGNVIGQIHYSFVRWENKFSLEISGERINQRGLTSKWGKQTVLCLNGCTLQVYQEKKWYFFEDNSWFNEWVHFNKSIINKSYKDTEKFYNYEKFRND